MKKIIYGSAYESETSHPKDWDDIFSTVLAWLCIIFLPVTIIAAVVLKIKKEIGFWKWIFQGMPDKSKHRWYALSVICTIGFCGLCAVIAVIDAVNERIRKYKPVAEDNNEKER